MCQHLPGDEIPEARRKAGSGISRTKKNGNEFGRGQVGSSQLEEGFLVLLTPLQAFRRQEEVPVAGNIRINDLGEEDGKAFGDDREEEIALPGRENIL